MIYISASNISVEYKVLSLANACNFQLPYQNTMPAEGPKILFGLFFISADGKANKITIKSCGPKKMRSIPFKTGKIKENAKTKRKICFCAYDLCNGGFQKKYIQSENGNC